MTQRSLRRVLVPFALTGALALTTGCGQQLFGQASASSPAAPATPTPTATTTATTTVTATTSESPSTESPSTESSWTDTSTTAAMTSPGSMSPSPTDPNASGMSPSTGPTSPAGASPNTETAAGANPATATPTAAPAPAPAAGGPRTIVVDGRTITGFPPGVTFPPGAKVTTTLAHSSTSGTVVVGPPDERTALTYFRAALPKAGYRVLADTGGTLTFAGLGFRGSMTGNGVSGVVITWSELTP